MTEKRYGEVPSSPAIMAACDSLYFMKFAPAFVGSIAKNTNFNIHLHVVNPTDEVLALACYLNSRVENRVTYTFNDLDLTTLGKDFKVSDVSTRPEVRAYYASLRFLVAPYILQHASQLLILDIDCMVMTDFDFPKKPVGYFPREPLPNTVGWEQAGTQCAAGCVYFHKDALNVCNAVADTLGGLELRWFNDQIALNHVISQVPEQLVHPFDGNFMDWEFKEGTTIWTGKGPRKYDNKTYLSKQHAYDDAIMDNDQWAVILAPRLDIPFKKFDLVREKTVNEPIREHWKNFIDKHVYYGYYKVEAPRWMFNNKISKYFKNAKMLVPHVEHHIFKGDQYTYYYMQTVFPWLFTIDSLGWAGGASYISTFDPEAEYNDVAFVEMQKYISIGSKFQHLQSKNTNWKGINDDYIIVPLQLPHDETIKYHSDITVPEFVTALCEFADNYGPCPQIVFKGHPVNLASMEPLKEIISKYKNVHYIADGNFHDLVRKSMGMWVLNGGSGQEAMLLEKPVVCFGRCDYALAVVQGDINLMGDMWNKFYPLYASKTIDGNPRWLEQLELYKKWYDWYDGVTVDVRP